MVPVTSNQANSQTNFLCAQISKIILGAFQGRNVIWGISGSSLIIASLALFIFTNLAPLYILFYDTLAALTLLTVSCCMPDQTQNDYLSITIPETPRE